MAEYFPSQMIGRAQHDADAVIFVLIFGFQIGIGARAVALAGRAAAIIPRPRI